MTWGGGYRSIFEEDDPKDLTEGLWLFGGFGWIWEEESSIEGERVIAFKYYLNWVDVLICAII